VRRTWSVVNRRPCGLVPVCDRTGVSAGRGDGHGGAAVAGACSYARTISGPDSAGCEKLVFDKTGTLTLETPVLLNPGPWRRSTRTRGPLCHALVRDNPHPASQCLLENLLAAGAPEPLAGEVRETVGLGVELFTATGRPLVARPADWPEVASFVTHKVTLSRARESGGEVILACDGRRVGAFGLADLPRADARAGSWHYFAARGYEAVHPQRRPPRKGGGARRPSSNCRSTHGWVS